MGVTDTLRSWVAIILASALGVCVVLFTGAAAWALVSKELTLSDAQTALLSTILGGIAGGLFTWLGVAHGAAAAQPAAATAAAGAPSVPLEGAEAPQEATQPDAGVPGQERF